MANANTCPSGDRLYLSAIIYRLLIKDSRARATCIYNFKYNDCKLYVIVHERCAVLYANHTVILNILFSESIFRIYLRVQWVKVAVNDKTATAAAESPRAILDKKARKGERVTTGGATLTFFAISWRGEESLSRFICASALLYRVAVACA